MTPSSNTSVDVSSATPLWQRIAICYQNHRPQLFITNSKFTAMKYLQIIFILSQPIPLKCNQRTVRFGCTLIS